MKVTGVVLAGGKSRRMGRDKALLVLPEGDVLLRRTVQVAAAVCERVLVVGRERPAEWGDDEAAFVPDAAVDVGPAAGLLAALRRAEAPVLLLPCDAPHLTVEALEWLGERFAQGRVTCVASAEGQVQPLFAVYLPECLPLLEARLAEGKRSLVGFIDNLRQTEQAVIVEAPEWVARAITDVDTPEDWARATGVST